MENRPVPRRRAQRSVPSFTFFSQALVLGGYFEVMAFDRNGRPCTDPRPCLTEAEMLKVVNRMAGARLRPQVRWIPCPGAPAPPATWEDLSG